ncbi:L-arabinose isomerase [uncultured Victivallis sp.]|uniref:L-arabinose isomerase n=1 Tax=uncultured Victivallis sp. TaxID=354118 RepID=UPI0025EC4B48|nr:L-arabinose isomerase [uncultured Victivallis sp.]
MGRRIDAKKCKIRFITGSQHLYGEETLKQVAANSRAVVEMLNGSGEIPQQIVWQPTVTTQAEVTAAIIAANSDPECAGVICWMHTFSPAKMWINGLKLLQKPMLHLNTQANRDIPWSTIDMDFMNLNQAAHGDREFGFICTRLGIARKVVNGHCGDPLVRSRIAAWVRAATAWLDSQTMRIARFGDNMREVAVTEGNKVSAQIAFGYAVDGYGVGDLAEVVREVADTEVDELVREYRDLYTIPDRSDAAMASIRTAARQEIGIRRFLEEGNYSGFTDTFEDLHGFDQLPGLAAQRLMADGYGFGAEGDWKTAALLHSLKVMACGLPGGVSFMEDYTYHFEPGRGRVLGSHMLEVCPSIAAAKPTLEVHPLGIGGKSDPARLVFGTKPGPALNASMIELDGHFRLVVNEVEVVAPDEDLPKLPVARTVWIPKPDLAEGARRWIEAGGAHHSVHAPALTPEHLRDFARIAGVELIEIR